MSVAPAERASTASAQPVMTQRQITLVIVGLMAGMFLSSLDQTIVSTAIRTIGDDLHGLEQQAWVTTAYMITSTISTPIYGKLSDIFGRRPLYLFGIGVFILGSFLSSFSTSMMMLAAFRAFQGIGAGALMSLPMAIMGDMLAPRERAKYQGYFLAVFGISSVLGPLIGGVFAGADSLLWVTGWRWVFLVNVPIGIIALGMVWKFLHLPSFGNNAAKPRIDWWGATFVIVALVPLLLVAEQGREWGWGSTASIASYVVSGLGLIAFLIVESKMGQDAIIPLHLFGNGTFSMSTILGFLVGFAMFGAMMTIPLYLQIVVGLTPTESGLATLPMMAGIMLSSIVSGQIVSKTGKYRIFPIIGTLLVTAGYYYLTFLTVDRPLWFLMIGMFIIGSGMGQLMQSLTLATQNAVQPRDMGVATSAATFFRQIGGTMGTAVLLSVLFTAMPNNIMSAMSNEDDLRSALDAATNPAVASAPENAGIMDQMWNKIVDPVKSNIQTQLDGGANQAKAAAEQAVRDQVTAAVQGRVDSGEIPAEAAQGIIDQQIAENQGAAEEQALSAAAEQAHATVSNGTLTVDWANDDQRAYWVDQIAPQISEEISNNADSDSENSDDSASTSDTSYLDGADSRLTRPFMRGFTESAVTVYWVGFVAILVAFILSLFFKVPPLRNSSALQEAADKHHADNREPEAVTSSNVIVAETVAPGTAAQAIVPEGMEDPAKTEDKVESKPSASRDFTYSDAALVAAVAAPAPEIADREAVRAHDSRATAEEPAEQPVYNVRVVPSADHSAPAQRISTESMIALATSTMSMIVATIALIKSSKK